MTRWAIVAVGLLGPHLAEAGRDARGFFVPPAAVDVVEESAKGYSSIRYYVREPYPAESTIAFICRNLAEHGWHPVTGNALEKYETSSLEAGWDELPGKSGRVVTRIWSARWLDRKGNQVIYTLGYSSPWPSMGSSRCTCWLAPCTTTRLSRRCTELNCVRKLSVSAAGSDRSHDGQSKDARSWRTTRCS